MCYVASSCDKARSGALHIKLGHAVSVQAHPHSRTWDGWRWLFVLFFALFAAIGVWLGLSASSSASSVALLVAIPAVFALVSLAVALFATDARLQRIATFFLAFS